LNVIHGHQLFFFFYEIIIICSIHIGRYPINQITVVMEPFPSLDDICIGEAIPVQASHEVNEDINSNNPHDVNEVEIVPKVHMCFDTLDAVKVFYRNFAKQSGFGVRIRSSLRGSDNEINYIKLVCSREGNYIFAIPTELKTVPSQKKSAK